MNIALILAGGTGTRLGSDIPKQYIKVNNKRIISYCLETICSHEDIDAVQIVADQLWHDVIDEEIERLKESMADEDVASKFKGISLPGKTRQLSILNGLKDIRQYADAESVVLIHDAARPLLSKEMITSCFSSINGYDGVIPVLPMKDTVYMSEDGKAISKLVNREKIFAGQAPEAFRLGKYYQACMDLMPEKILSINGSTEPAIMAGLSVAMIPGDENNFKITTANDLKRFEEMSK